jgi:hypothetical protein
MSRIGYNIKITPSHKKPPLQETILDYIDKIERAYPDLIAKMPRRQSAVIDDILAKKLQAKDGSSPLFTRTLLELVFEEIQDMKAMLEDIRKQKDGRGPGPCEQGEDL